MAVAQALARAVRFAAGWGNTILMSGMACLLCGIGLATPAWLAFPKPWARGTLRIFGIALDIAGEENMSQAGLYVANHESLVDIFVFPATLPRKVRYVAKRELGRIPFFGWLLAWAGAFMIDRASPQSAIESIRRGMARLPPGWSVLVMPEGTRGGEATLGPFKKGAVYMAIESRMPVIPVGTHWSPTLFPRGAWMPRPGTIHVTIGEPIATGDWRVETLDRHLELMRQRVLSCMARSRSRLRQAPLPGPQTLGPVLRPPS